VAPLLPYDVVLISRRNYLSTVAAIYGVQCQDSFGTAVDVVNIINQRPFFPFPRQYLLGLNEKNVHVPMYYAIIMLQAGIFN